MPRQSPEHRTERASRTAFLSAVPSNWEVRDVTPDLGIDLMVEIYDNCGVATGTMFGVQLKATTSDSDSPKTQLRLSHKHHSYYRSLQVPLLLVRCSVQPSRILVRWHHSFDPGAGDTVNAESVTFHFSDANLLTPELARLLERDAARIRLLRSGNCPTVIGFAVTNSVPDLSDESWRHITLVLDRYLKQFASLIRQSNSFDHNCLGDVCVFPDKIVVSLATLSSVTLHLKASDAEMLEALLPESFVFGAGATLMQAGLVGVGLKVLMQYLLACDNRSVDCFIGAAGLLLNKPQFHGDLRFFLDHSGPSLGGALSLQVLCHLPLFHLEGVSEAEMHSLVLRLHAIRVQVEKDDPKLCGILCYHLARLALFDRSGDRAAALLQEASTLAPFVADTPFFAGDMGAAWYLRGDIAKASEWYNKQLEKYYFPQYEVMNGHCRLLLGDLDGARKALKHFDGSLPRLGPWSLLLAYALDWLGQERRAVDPLSSGSSGGRGQKADEWERMADNAACKGDWATSFHAQLLCSLTRVTDADSWERAVVLARQYAGPENDDIVFACLAAAFQLVGDQLIEAAERFAKANIPEEHVDRFIKGQAEAGRVAPHEPEMRKDVVLLNRRGEMLSLMAEGHTITMYRDVDMERLARSRTHCGESGWGTGHAQQETRGDK